MDINAWKESGKDSHYGYTITAIFLLLQIQSKVEGLDAKMITVLYMHHS